MTTYRKLFLIILVSLSVFIMPNALYANYVPGEAVVLMRGDVNVAAASLASADINLSSKPLYTMRQKTGSIHKVTFPKNRNMRNVLQTLQDRANIDIAEPNYKFTLTSYDNEPFYSDQWNLEQIGTSQGWSVDTGSSNVKMAVIDSSIDRDHPELNGRLDIVPGADVINNDDDPGIDDSTNTDTFIHGTPVTAVAAASWNKHQIAGIAPSVTVIPIRAFNGAESSIATIASGIDKAINNDADVINMSFASEKPSSLLKSVIEDGYDDGVVFATASGNRAKEDNNADTVYYPAAYDKTLATGSNNENKERSSFSNFGPNLDIVAPGGDDGNASFIASVSSETTNSDEAEGWTGTSFSAPHVSGAFSIGLSINDGRSVSTQYEIIRDTAEDLNANGFDEQTGHGLLRVDRYLEHMPFSQYSGPFSVTMPDTISTGDTQVTVTVSIDQDTSAPAKINDIGLSFSGQDFDYQFENNISSTRFNNSNDAKFTVSVDTNADTGLYSINELQLTAADVYDQTDASGNFALTNNDFTVQKQANPVITESNFGVESASTGDTNISASLTVKNSGEADLILEQANLSFTESGNNVNSDYSISRNTSLPVTIDGGASKEISYTIDVQADPTIGTITLNGAVSGKDGNSDLQVQSNVVNNADTFIVSAVQVTKLSLTRDTYTMQGAISSDSVEIGVVVKNNDKNDTIEVSPTDNDIQIRHPTVGNVTEQFTPSYSNGTKTIAPNGDTATYQYIADLPARSSNLLGSLNVKLDKLDAKNVNNQNRLSAWGVKQDTAVFYSSVPDTNFAVQSADGNLKLDVPKDKYSADAAYTIINKENNKNSCINTANNQAKNNNDIFKPKKSLPFIREVVFTKPSNDQDEPVQITMKSKSKNEVFRENLLMFVLNKQGGCEWEPVQTKQKQTVNVSATTFSVQTIRYEFSTFRLLGSQKTTPTASDFHVAPNPFKPYDGNVNTGSYATGIKFYNVPAGDKITIYTITRKEVAQIISSGTLTTWNARNNSGEQVASGVYLYQTENGKTGKIAITR